MHRPARHPKRLPVLYARLAISVLLLGLCGPFALPARAFDPPPDACDTLVQQVASTDQDLQGLQATAAPLLQEAAVLGPVASNEILAIAAGGSIPGETPEL